jgi:Ser/Thr protein kinase RdoA (MazF antagonist)
VEGVRPSPRLADFAYLMWGTWLNPEWIEAAVGAYRQHIELTDEELDRLEAVMYVHFAEKGSDR